MISREIGIWAPLRYSNYGDDMQALAFAQTITSMGYSVKIYQLDDSLAQSYGFKSVQTLEELCEGVNLIIIAGGALLTPFRWYKRLLNRAAREYEVDFKELYFVSLRNPNIKFCAISFGGDGNVKNPEKWFSHWRIAFFESPSFLDGTVRLSGDVNMMQVFGKNMVFFPDMLFRAPDFFPPEMLQPSMKYRVGFNFKRGRYLDEKLIDDIFRYAEANDDMEFHFVTTHMEKIGLNYQYVPEHPMKNIYIDRYENPCQLLGVLASMDCFMTSMLHVGLTGLTTGTPFVSYRGPGKTKSFLKSIGGDWAILPDNISFGMLRSSIWNKSRKQLYNQYDTAEIDHMKKESMKHYDFCKYIVEKFA